MSMFHVFTKLTGSNPKNSQGSAFKVSPLIDLNIVFPANLTSNHQQLFRKT